MTKANRVTPFGDIVASPLRGAWTGNRGQLPVGEMIVRFHRGDRWITCELEFRDRRNRQWQPGHFTFLFFHDEAVALAAGHRPCGECRRGAYNAYRAAWADAVGLGIPSAKAMDRQLHQERIISGTHERQLHEMSWRDLPVGAFVSTHRLPYLVLSDEIVSWSSTGYGKRQPRPTLGAARVITPPSSIAVLRAEYPVQIDLSARVHSVALR